MVGNRKRRVQFAEQMGIYVLYDKFEQPVQIGQSKVIYAPFWPAEDYSA
jgi:hypothetical protein